MAPATPNKLHFSTHAELKNVIGQDLINDDNIAIIELVKNGIDAGAKKISLQFIEELPGTQLSGPAIFVEDDGSGMALEDVESKWLNIAFSAKKEQQVPGRALAGNKGVGRFACDRLGSRLDMFTRCRGGALIHIAVDWVAFENKRSFKDTIQKVNILQSEVSPDEMHRMVGRTLRGKGTTLVISSLRSSWDREALLQLKRQLQRFVSPIAAFERDAAAIKISAPGEKTLDDLSEPHDRINGPVENQIFDRLKFKTTYIQAHLAGDGRTLTTELFHEGQRVYRLVEDVDDFKPLKDVVINLHYMNPYKKSYFKRETGLHLVEFGSIFLFVNGYRVSPYGDRYNDWLELDSRKSQAMNRVLGSRELLGQIFVKDKGTHFRVVSNREGIVRNKEYFALTERKTGFFYSVLGRLERFVVDGLRWDSVSEAVRKRLQSGALPGTEDMPEGELYEESDETKRRRIALDVLRIVGASAASTTELEIDPQILEALSREREEDVRAILEKFNAFDTTIVGHDVKLALGRVQREFERQKAELSKARKDASRKEHQVKRLSTVARSIAERNVQLSRQVSMQETELLFSRVASGSDQEQLLLLHHQSGIYAVTAKGFLEKALSQLKLGNSDKATELIEKALNSTSKVVTVSNFATKANFRLKTGTLTADIAQFIQEYVLNVAKDTSAQNLKLSVHKSFQEPFVIRFKPIELAIVFDNVASNSTRARAKWLYVEMSRPSDNELRIDISDDGPGISPEVQPPEKVFERGVTTTNGSGLGLYHVRETLKQMGGTIQLGERGKSGFALTVRLFK